MSDQEVAVQVEQTPAPAEPQVTAPESAEAAPQTPEATKTFTQEELDAIVAKRLAREQRKWERQQRPQQQVPETPKELPPAEQFESVEAYAQALAEQKAQQLLQQRDMERQQAELLETYAEREEQARDKYDDFETVAYNPNLRITTVMAQTIQASDIGPDLAYYLGSHPKEADRISRLSPILQAKEIGKIEAKLASSPMPVKKQSSAPAPITPVTARTAGTPAYDTTDPRSVKTMSTSEWIEADRQRQIRKWQAQQQV